MMQRHRTNTAIDAATITTAPIAAPQAQLISTRPRCRPSRIEATRTGIRADITTDLRVNNFRIEASMSARSFTQTRIIMTRMERKGLIVRASSTTTKIRAVHVVPVRRIQPLPRRRPTPIRILMISDAIRWIITLGITKLETAMGIECSVIKEV